MNATTPHATVVRVKGHIAVIECPYCRHYHEHQHTKRGAEEWRAPACGMFLSPDSRATGYRFTVPAESSDRTTPRKERTHE